MTQQNLSTETQQEFTITRVFDASPEQVFQAFTQPEHLVHWWGPKGFVLEVSSLDLRPGGTFLYCDRSPQGQEMWGKFVYQEIVQPERLVFVNSFADAAGNVVRAPFSNNWPLEILNHLTFSEQEGKTLLTMRGGPIHATDAEVQAFVGNFKSMEQGFGGTFDQLAEHLTRMQKPE